jgi:RNA polymerase sigma factor (sigma-70 family)
VVVGLASPNVETRRVAFDALVSAYWRPVYKYVRIKWRADRDDAADLTQEFFARAFEKGSLGRFDPARARFRTYLRVCLDGFVANEHKAAARIKRGGDIAFVSLDFAAAEHEMAERTNASQPPGSEPADVDDDALFRHEWVRAMFADAVECVRQSLIASGKETHFVIFERYDLVDEGVGERPTYAALAREHDVPVTQVTNYLAFVRRELRRTVLERLREAANAPDATGTKYEILERIGQGGMGAVYRARDLELGRDVALKVVRLPEGSADVAARMLREARTLARLEHPSIVPVHDVGTLADGRAFYAMKLVRGAPLDALAPTPLTDRLEIIERICEAVAFAHANGVIHRDLKPQNVMVGPFGEVLVMDWGVAKLDGVEPESLGSANGSRLARSEPSTGHGVILGTPGYMAPEQAAGAPGLVDARSDVYAIGAILRDLCRTAVGTAESPANWPRPVRAIIERAMAPDPANRYPSAIDLARDVAAFRAGDRITAYRENIFERGRRLAIRHSTPILLVLAYLIMRVTLLAVFRR